jgi:putative ABC transport system permease protein
MSLYNQVEPQIFPYHNNTIASVMVRLSGDGFREDLNNLEQVFDTYYPDDPFVYRFLDDRIREHYIREDKAMTIFSYFSVLTISISCLGLFGLSSLTVYQRKKEIGIRRIIGADFKSIIYLFSKEYILLLLIATTLVGPLVWYGMDYWLNTFPYRQALSVLVFFACGVGVIAAALCTVLFSLGRIFRILPVSLIREN